MVFEVSEVGARFEVVTAAIRGYAAVGYVDFANTPAIEARFME